MRSEFSDQLVYFSTCLLLVAFVFVLVTVLVLLWLVCDLALVCTLRNFLWLTLSLLLLPALGTSGCGALAPPDEGPAEGEASEFIWEAWEGDEQVVGTRRDNTAEEDDADGGDGQTDDDGPAENDEYEATSEASGADAKGGFRGDDDPEAGSPLVLDADEPATTSSLALSTLSNFRFWLRGDPVTATITGAGSGDIGCASRSSAIALPSSASSAAGSSGIAARPTSSGRTPWLTSACKSSGSMATMAWPHALQLGVAGLLERQYCSSVLHLFSS